MGPMSSYPTPLTSSTNPSSAPSAATIPVKRPITDVPRSPSDSVRALDDPVANRVELIGRKRSAAVGHPRHATSGVHGRVRTAEPAAGIRLVQLSHDV